MTKILVIEDEDPVRANLLEMLDAEGFSVMGAENGRVGVQLARDYLPNLVICDIMMPELDGHGVLAELRQDPLMATVPFIFLTAKADRGDLRHGMELGADDYLTKPFTLNEVLRAVSSRLEKQTQVSTYFRRELEALRSNIAASLPHEFLTPLTVILAASEILARHPDRLEPGEVPEIAERIHSSAERLHRLIKNFLLYTRLELAATDPEKAEALRGYSVSDARAVITEVALHVAQEAGRATDLRLELCDATPWIEQVHLKKIIEELLDNAFKYSRAGAPVTVRCNVDDARIFTLTVTDRGRGMTVEQIARVGAYVQFDREEHEQQGQGLGLAIVKRLTELHSGELSLESRRGLQTTVHVALPAQTA
jgi:two-component system sensor histidine kinase/response regulator